MGWKSTSRAARGRGNEKAADFSAAKAANVHPADAGWTGSGREPGYLVDQRLYASLSRSRPNTTLRTFTGAVAPQLPASPVSLNVEAIHP